MYLLIGYPIHLFIPEIIYIYSVLNIYAYICIYAYSHSIYEMNVGNERPGKGLEEGKVRGEGMGKIM